MFVIEYLNKHSGTVEALEKLKDELGIKYSINENYPELVVLNYCQIDSPKHHPITLECRSLVLEMPIYSHAAPAGCCKDWTVVSSGFDRFFNLQEVDCGYNMMELHSYDKMDGSLCCLFNYRGEWLYRTRSMIMPTESIFGHDYSWGWFIEACLGWSMDSLKLDTDYTYIFEVCGPENRVVTRYTERKAYLLAARHSTLRHYMAGHKVDQVAREHDWPRPTRHTFESVAEIKAAALALRDLEEGYVMYNRHEEPVVKCKNPAYVAAHHLRGEGPKTPKQIINLIIIGETDEYLGIFPEDKPSFDPYLDGWEVLWNEVSSLWPTIKDIEDPREFAISIKDAECKHILFGMRKGLTGREAFDRFLDTGKRRLVETYARKHG